MTINELIELIPMETLSGEQNLNREISGGFSSDMMSNVIAKGTEGEIWITFQTHLNVVAIALMKKMAGVILIQNRTLIPKALERAKAENLPVLITPLSSYELAGRLYKLGIKGD